MDYMNLLSLENIIKTILDQKLNMIIYYNKPKMQDIKLIIGDGVHQSQELLGTIQKM